MSSITWTHDALSSEAKPYKGRAWRVVEAQHLASTMSLVDTLDEQALLEEEIEATKPPIPPECQGLDFLLFSPFRYGAPYPEGSRFRRAGHTPGVYYGSEGPETAIAETAFHRRLFFADSPDTPWPSRAFELTAFAVEIDTERALDLTAEPLSRDHAAWTHPQDYGPCQALAGQARMADISLIRYQSVRDPEKRANMAILSCAAFASAAPADRQSWHMSLSDRGALARCEYPRAEMTLLWGAE